MRTFQRMCLFPIVCALAFFVQGLTGSVAHAMYDLSQGPVRYQSDGGTYRLSWEKPLDTLRPSVTANEVKHGKYLAHNDAEGGTLDFSYDIYDDGSFTIYDHEGGWENITFYPGMGFYSGKNGWYTFNFYAQQYVSQFTGHALDKQVESLLKICDNDPSFHKVGARFNTDTVDGRQDFEIMLYPENKPAASSHLPSMWYVMKDTSDSDTWVAFTYNKDTGVYTMYHRGEDGTEIYSYRKFLDNNTLQISKASTDSTDFGGDTGTYTKNSDGRFYRNGGSNNIYKYITDGMLLFRNQCVKR